MARRHVDGAYRQETLGHFSLANILQEREVSSFLLSVSHKDHDAATADRIAVVYEVLYIVDRGVLKEANSKLYYNIAVGLIAEGYSHLDFLAADYI